MDAQKPNGRRLPCPAGKPIDGDFNAILHIGIAVEDVPQLAVPHRELHLFVFRVVPFVKIDLQQNVRPRAASTISRQPATVTSRGFSTSTCFPAAQVTAISRWRWSGVTMVTPSSVLARASPGSRCSLGQEIPGGVRAAAPR